MPQQWQQPVRDAGAGAAVQQANVLCHVSLTLLPTAAPFAAGLLSDNNRLSELGRILGKFEEIVADQRGEVKAVVTTAEVRALTFTACLPACLPAWEGCCATDCQCGVLEVAGQ